MELAGQAEREHVAQTALLGLRLFSLKKNCVSGYADAMSRLRRPFFTERFFFLTVKLLPKHRHLSKRDFAVLTRSLDTVRSRQWFLLTAPVFLPELVRLWGMPSCFRLIL